MAEGGVGAVGPSTVLCAKAEMTTTSPHLVRLREEDHHGRGRRQKRMAKAFCLLIVSTLGAAVLTFAIFLPAQSPSPSPSSGTRHALIFRHCVRSTSTSIKNVVGAFGNAADYTDLPLPSWGVPPKWCTPGGIDILQNTGVHLRSLIGDSVTRLRVVSDTSQRDADTSLAVAAGFCAAALPTCATVSYDPLLFSASDPDLGIPPLCNEALSDAQQAAAVQQRLASIPTPTSITTATALLQSLIGVGAAGNASSWAPTGVTSDGKLTGASNVLKFFSQAILYALASGIDYPLHLRAKRCIS